MPLRFAVLTPCILRRLKARTGHIGGVQPVASRRQAWVAMEGTALVDEQKTVGLGPALIRHQTRKVGAKVDHPPRPMPRRTLSSGWHLLRPWHEDRGWPVVHAAEGGIQNPRLVLAG